MPTRKPPTARIFRGTQRNLRFLARALQQGQIVAVPTETVYGLAASAWDAEACRKIFRAKGRPLLDPLIVHLHAASDLGRVCVPSAAALKLAEKFWPGPLTLVLPKRPEVPDIVTANRPSVAVRVPSHPLFRRLLKMAALPLAAPSANPFGYVSPTTARHVRENLGRKIRYILDGGAADIGVESTIVDLREPDHPRLLRPGAITAEELSRVLGQIVEPASASRRERRSKLVGELAPGSLRRHYSPKARVILHRWLEAGGRPDAAYVFLRQPAGPRRKNVFWLDPRGDLRGVARGLFATLRKLDAARFREIHVELAPDEGIGVAINDRLRRAAAQ